MLDYCVYLVYRAGVGLLGLLPLSVIFALGRTAGWLAWLGAGGYRRLARHNLELAFDRELTERERSRLVREHFQRLGANLLCSIKFTSWPIEKILVRVRVDHPERIERFQQTKKPFVLLLSHLASWELCAQLLPRFVPHARKLTVYQRMRNRYIDEHVRAARARFDVELSERSEGFARAIDALRSGGTVGILADQHAGDQGLWTPFFGRLASTTTLPALLAKRTGAAILPCAIASDGTARWRVIFEEPFASDAETIEELTARGNRALETQVRREPADWFWVHNRWKTPTPNFLLARYRRGIFIPAGETLKPFHILIRSTNWLGDAVMSIPAVRAIKHGRPDAQLTVATPEKLTALWREVKEVDHVLPIPTRSIFGAAKAMRGQGPFDVAVLFPNSLRSALEAKLAGIPRLAGFRGHSRSRLLHQFPRGKPTLQLVHQATRYLQLATTFGAVPHPIDRTPAPRARREQLRCALCPGAEYGPAKRWLPERFAEVAQEISNRHKVSWVLIGTEKDAALGQTIASALGERCENRIGQTTLAELIGELRQCDLLLTNDTGTMHLASILGVPVVAIFGSTEPKLTSPFGSPHEIIRHHVACSPCFLRECPLDFRCMREVQMAEVIAAVEHLLAFAR